MADEEVIPETPVEPAVEPAEPIVVPDEVV